MLETKRLLLRPFEPRDAEDLYRYASSPEIGPVAGWPVHTSVKNSLQIIQTVLAAPETYAVVLKTTDRVVGSIGLTVGSASHYRLPESEGEIGYWLGVPYWGQGLIPETAQELLRHGFNDLKLTKIWCGYFEGNEKSHRVMEKCGFQYHHTAYEVPCALPGVLRNEIVTCLTKEQWQWHRLYLAAQAVHQDRTISAFIQAGSMAAALLTVTGQIYTGVCVDTSCSLGCCAERNAIFQLLTGGETPLISKVLILMPDGTCGLPCGACRELMLQLAPQQASKLEVMVNYELKQTVTLKELTPQWWIPV